jgi:Uncharacterized protein conserved in bacteria
MALIGRRNTLPIVRAATPGLYLDGGPLGEILLPGKYARQGLRAGQTVEVFVYRDSEDRLVATTETPFAQVGEFGLLRVVSVNSGLGAFLDWGLEKDLLLPIRELGGPVKPGEWILVHVSLDPKTQRIVASGRINRHLNLTPPPYAEGQAVKLIVAGETPLGYNVIVEHAHRGLLYRTDLAGPLTIGQPLDGYVREVRADGKIDCALDRAGFPADRSDRGQHSRSLESRRRSVAVARQQPAGRNPRDAGHQQKSIQAGDRPPVPRPPDFHQPPRDPARATGSPRRRNQAAAIERRVFNRDAALAFGAIRIASRSRRGRILGDAERGQLRRAAAEDVASDAQFTSATFGSARRTR